MVRFISYVRAARADGITSTGNGTFPLSQPNRAAPESCFGIACPHHCKCALYAAVEDNVGEPISTCIVGNEYPLYREKK